MIVAEDFYPEGIVYNEPWPFIVVDNFLSQDSYNYLMELKQHHFVPLDGSDGKRTLLVNHTDATSWKGTIKFLNKNLNDEVLQTLYKHIGEENVKPYVLLTELVKCDPNYLYSKHVDHKLKLYSIVVYIDPQQGNGTILLDSSDNEYEVKWRRNRALIFKYDSKAYHYYKNTFQDPRISLNVNIVATTTQFTVA